MARNTPPAKRYERDSQGLREALFETIEGLNGGTLSGAEGQAVAKAAQAIIASAKLDLEAHKQLVDAGNADTDAANIAPPTLRLGRASAA